MRSVPWVVAIGVIGFCSCKTVDYKQAIDSLEVSGEVKRGASASQISAALRRAARIEGTIEANAERPRGSGEAVYPQVAPATVFIKLENSYGSGFIIDAEGWILTNHHVIADAPIDPQLGAPVASVHLGRLEKGVMSLIDDPVEAHVYKADPVKDLALLKLAKVPPDLQPLSVVAFANEVPKPGVDCVSIGHPAAGMLWTVRSGGVASVGMWPRDGMDLVFARLSASGEDRQWLEQALGDEDLVRIVVSSFGINPGNSGGPLLNKQGELIGVSYAGPADPELDKMGYHVHLNEVREFAAQRPGTPIPSAPDPWPAGVSFALEDLDSDETADTIAFFGLDDEVLGIVLDLDQDSTDVDEDAPWEAWDFEFSYHGDPFRTFYDSDSDGSIDLILEDKDFDGTADSTIVRGATGWRFETAEGRKMFDPTIFKDPAIRVRFVEILSSF